jgi:hypothetical protein
MKWEHRDNIDSLTVVEVANRIRKLSGVDFRVHNTLYGPDENLSLSIQHPGGRIMGFAELHHLTTIEAYLYLRGVEDMGNLLHERGTTSTGGPS